MGRKLAPDHKVIEITERIIKDSEARSSSHCMIADGVKAAVPEARFVSVDIQTIRYTDIEKGERYVYLTPKRAQEAIIRFDQGMEQEPFTIQLRQPMVQKAGKNRSRKDAGAKLVTTRKNSKKEVPAVTRIEGGHTPPRAPGNRRTFGVRGLTI